MDAIDYQLARAVLSIEARRWQRPGRKVQAIHDELGLSDVAFAQLLNRIIDEPGTDVALEFGPLLARLARLRSLRQQQRSARRAS